MKGDPKVIKHLAKALRMELTATNEYLLHSQILRDWGYGKLAEKLDQESLEERGHANVILERILFLGGSANVHELNDVHPGKSVSEIFENDLQSELNARKAYTVAASQCQESGDVGSRQLFESLIADEEGHIDWLETQLELMKQLGEANYLQAHMSSAEDHA